MGLRFVLNFAARRFDVQRLMVLSLSVLCSACVLVAARRTVYRMLATGHSRFVGHSAVLDCIDMTAPPLGNASLDAEPDHLESSGEKSDGSFTLFRI